MDRKNAVKYALSSMRMEGFIFTDEELIVFEKLANGEISHEDVKKIAADKLKNWKLENPECFTKER